MMRTKENVEEPIVARLDNLTDQVEKLLQAQKAPARAAYRPQEVAEMIGVSVPLIYGEIRSGNLRAIRINNSIIVPMTAMEKWLAEENRSRIRDGD